jgi:hypothetical protein
MSEVIGTLYEHCDDLQVLRDGRLRYRMDIPLRLLESAPNGDEFLERETRRAAQAMLRQAAEIVRVSRHPHVLSPITMTREPSPMFFGSTDSIVLDMTLTEVQSRAVTRTLIHHEARTTLLWLSPDEEIALASVVLARRARRLRLVKSLRAFVERRRGFLAMCVILAVFALAVVK